MPGKGSTVYIQFASETKRRVLHRTTVTETAGTDKLTLCPEEEGLPVEAGLELLIYFEHRRQFMQQPARVGALLEGESGAVYVLETVGDPVSADSRQCYRVSTVVTGLTASLGGEAGCPLHDVSVTGFAVIATGRFDLGQVLDAELLHEGMRFTGKASVQSVRDLGDGRYRYGVNCVKSAQGTDSLSKGVQQISMTVQRQQLNRLAGGA